MRVAQVNIVRPRTRIDPERLLADWPTLPAIAAAAQRAGAEVTVVQSFHRDAEFVADGVRYRFVAEPALPGRATGLRPGRLARAVADGAPQILHVNGLDFARHMAALRRLRLPVLVQDHASRAGAGGAPRRRALAGVAGIAFTATDQAGPFVAAGELAPDIPVFAVPESSTAFSPGDQTAARARCGMHGDPAVLWVGRLDPNKDPLTMLDAIEIAARRLPALHFWCCFHDQPLLPAVLARIAGSPSLAERVHLLGRVAHAEIETLLNAADVFLLGSHREGSGYALIEALACGATPIVSDIAPFRAIAGPVGALVPVGDAAAFAAAMVELAPRDRMALRRQAIEHFRRELSFDRVGARLCAIYAELIGAGR
ncbi:MAG: glycosyltransferase family 4 protein [Sphingomonas sp.]|uniref:glycosyltransferase family 4 protein n=1 Tax=Sphingomonas sp. TaxID=28214 RepID=UPI003F80A0BF